MIRLLSKQIIQSRFVAKSRLAVFPLALAPDMRQCNMASPVVQKKHIFFYLTNDFCTSVRSPCYLLFCHSLSASLCFWCEFFSTPFVLCTAQQGDFSLFAWWLFRDLSDAFHWYCCKKAASNILWVKEWHKSLCGWQALLVRGFMYLVGTVALEE